MTRRTILTSLALSAAGVVGVFAAPAEAEARDTRCYSVRYHDRWGRPYTRVVCEPVRYYAPPRSHWRDDDYWRSHRAWHFRNDHWRDDNIRGWSRQHDRWHDDHGRHDWRGRDHDHDGRWRRW